MFLAIIFVTKYYPALLAWFGLVLDVERRTLLIFLACCWRLHLQQGKKKRALGAGAVSFSDTLKIVTLWPDTRFSKTKLEEIADERTTC